MYYHRGPKAQGKPLFVEIIHNDLAKFLYEYSTKYLIIFLIILSIISFKGKKIVLMSDISVVVFIHCKYTRLVGTHK